MVTIDKNSEVHPALQPMVDFIVKFGGDLHFTMNGALTPDWVLFSHGKTTPIAFFEGVGFMISHAPFMENGVAKVFDLENLPEVGGLL